MSVLDDAPDVHAADRATWRAWLEANHATAPGAWLVTWRPRSGRTGLDYEAAVEEALCVGWIDSTSRPFDDARRRLYFAPRKPRSVWAASNKARVERLIAAGRMRPAGLAAQDAARLGRGRAAPGDARRADREGREGSRPQRARPRLRMRAAAEAPRRQEYPARRRW